MPINSHDKISVKCLYLRIMCVYFLIIRSRALIIFQAGILFTIIRLREVENQRFYELYEFEGLEV